MFSRRSRPSLPSSIRRTFAWSFAEEHVLKRLTGPREDVGGRGLQGRSDGVLPGIEQKRPPEKTGKLGDHSGGPPVRVGIRERPCLSKKPRRQPVFDADRSLPVRIRASGGLSPGTSDRTQLHIIGTPFYPNERGTTFRQTCRGRVSRSDHPSLHFP